MCFSGFESKAIKYGEDEETFALQRAETGDARFNREHQTQRVNQQKESNYRYNNNNNNHQSNRPSNNNNNNNNDREIFKGSSSSNFFNNRNGGKEPDFEDEEGDARPANANQDNDREQKRKIVRKQNRRPVNNNQQQEEEKTQRPNRPTGFVNNFAGSYAPTTAKPFVSTEAPRRFANRQRTRVTPEQQAETTTTAAPLRQTQQYNTINRYSTTPKSTKEPENYPSNFPKKQTFAPTKNTENYPSTLPATNTQYETTKFKQTENYPTTVQTTQFNYPTTFPPKPFQKSTQFNSQKPLDTFPTTFAPRTNAAYTQIAQQTSQYNNNNNKKQTFAQPTTTNTQYTPTVPKVTTPYYQPTTTPVSRSNRYDETQYDDGSYNPKYDYDNGELIKTAHSTNIANSKNELAKSAATTSTQKPYYESPRPFSVTPKTVSTTQQQQQQNFSTKQQQNLSTKQQPQQQQQQSGKAQSPAKKEKNVSYDYAYYDANVGSEPEYDINTEFEKTSKKQKQ